MHTTTLIIAAVFTVALTPPLAIAEGAPRDLAAALKAQYARMAREVELIGTRRLSQDEVRGWRAQQVRWERLALFYCESVAGNEPMPNYEAAFADCLLPTLADRTTELRRLRVRESAAIRR